MYMADPSYAPPVLVMGYAKSAQGETTRAKIYGKFLGYGLPQVKFKAWVRVVRTALGPH